MEWCVKNIDGLNGIEVDNKLPGMNFVEEKQIEALCFSIEFDYQCALLTGFCRGKIGKSKYESLIIHTSSLCNDLRIRK